MGVWGTGINSNDTAADVLDACREIYSIVSPEEADRLMLNEFSEIVENNEDSDLLADFWYAYANWQWDHGVLPEKNKSIVLNLLQNQCGMDLWIEEGRQSDIRRRIISLNKLKEKILSDQPPVKTPRPKIDKPKHKPGTIIILKIGELFEHANHAPWTIQTLSTPKYFEVNDLKLPKELSHSYSAQGKYLAILCVGTEKESYSKYFPDLFHEHSVYTFYDYCEETPPTILSLRNCGFLPNIDISFSDFNNGIIDGLDWTYTFVTIDKFSSQNSLIDSFEQLESIDEVERFHRLISQKNYSNISIGCFTLQNAFESFYEEKLRFLEVGITIDNLLDSYKENPKLLSPTQYNKRNKK